MSMSNLLVSKTVVPPCGWLYIQKETGFKPEAPTLMSTAMVLLSHRVANSLPGAALKTCVDDIEDYICKFLATRGKSYMYCRSTTELVDLAKKAPAKRKTGGCSGCGKRAVVRKTRKK